MIYLFFLKTTPTDFKFCKTFFKTFTTVARNDSPIDFIFFLIYKIIYCIIFILLLTNFIPKKLCLTII